MPIKEIIYDPIVKWYSLSPHFGLQTAKIISSILCFVDEFMNQFKISS